MKQTKIKAMKKVIEKKIMIHMVKETITGPVSLLKRHMPVVDADPVLGHMIEKKEIKGTMTKEIAGQKAHGQEIRSQIIIALESTGIQRAIIEIDEDSPPVYGKEMKGIQFNTENIVKDILTLLFNTISYFKYLK